MKRSESDFYTYYDELRPRLTTENPDRTSVYTAFIQLSDQENAAGEPLFPGGLIKAVPAYWDNEDEIWKPATGQVIYVKDTGYCNCVLPGEKFQVRKESSTGHFRPVGARGLLRRAQVTEDQGINKDAEGKVALYNDADVMAEKYDITVQNTFLAETVKKDDDVWVLFVTDLTGDETQYPEQTGYWVIVHAGGGGSYIYFSANSDFETDAATVPATVIANLEGGDVQPGATVTCRNMQVQAGGHLFAGKSGNRGYAFKSAGQDDPDTIEWRIMQMECYIDPQGDWNPQ